MLFSNRKHKTCLVAWLAIAQAFVAHAIVPGLTLRPVAARAQSTSHAHDATIAPATGAVSRGTTICRIKASPAGEAAHLPGRRGRTDRCRAFFIAYKATPTKGLLDCLIIGLFLDHPRPFDSAASFPDAGFARSPNASPPAALTSLTISLCRPRC